MLAPVRLTRMLEEVRRARAVGVNELALLLGVSEMTVRRDLEVLARQGLVRRCMEVTIIDLRSTDEPGFERKSVLAGWPTAFVYSPTAVPHCCCGVVVVRGCGEVANDERGTDARRRTVWLTLPMANETASPCPRVLVTIRSCPPSPRARGSSAGSPALE
jgi:DNA-binding transcriptional ArsR family regulator